MYQHLGILGGISHVSTAAYYERIVTHFQRRSPDGAYPEITIASLDFNRFTDYETEATEALYVDYIMAGLERLQGAGAGVAIMAANSPHAVFAQLEVRSPLPLLSLVESTLAVAAEQDLRRLLLLGIEYTMQADYYPRAGKARGIDVFPPRPNHQRIVDDIIFDELCRNDIRDSSREALMDVIRAYDADGVILGCTELPLIISPEHAPDGVLPDGPRVLDTMAIHCEAAVNLCLGQGL